MLADQGFWEATCLGTNPESPCKIINNPVPWQQRY